MGNSAIVAKLQLDSKDYDRKLAEAKKKTRDFSKGGGSDLAAMAGKFKTLAVAVASSKVAMETFNRVVASSQTTSDAYARTMSTAKSITDEFAYAIGNVDFSSFASGLNNIRNRAKSAYDALDQLGNTKISYSFFEAKDRSAFSEGILTAKDTSLTESERQAGLDAARAAYSRIKTSIGALEESTTDYLRKEIARIANVEVSNVDASYLDKALSVDISKDAAVLRQEIMDRYDEYAKKLDKVIQDNTSTMQMGMWGTKDVRNTEAIAEAEAKLNAEYAETKALYGILVKLSDDQLRALAAEKIGIDQKRYAMGELVTQLREAERQMGSMTSVAIGLKPAGLPSPSSEPLADKISVPGLVPVVAFPGGSYEAYMAAKDEAEEYAAALETLDSVSVSASDGMGALGSAVANLSGLLGEGGAAWGNYVSGIMSAIGQAIPTIEALATAQASAAATTAALNPWNVVATVAAVSSVIAAMSQIPKFATGGVVPGNRLSGDNVLIRANSGEVVLTKTQANNIGSMLSGGLGGKVVFKIEGSTLVGVLNNHNRIAGRSYGYKNG